MKILCIALLLASSIVYTSLGAYLGVNDQGLHTFTIDMNLEPQERFKESSIFFKDQIHGVVGHF